MSEGRTASFEVDIVPDHARQFAELSGDWNPLHTDAGYAATTPYRRPVLHGAFSAGLFSRMAGMHLPGHECLLHGIKLRFIAPIQPPARVVVQGWEIAPGRVEVTVVDAATGTRYVDGSYEFGTHAGPVTDRSAGSSMSDPASARTRTPSVEATPRILVTGATGGLGSAVLRALGDRAIGVSRRAASGLIHAPNPDGLSDAVGDVPIAGIVHCGWPSPDNAGLLDLDRSTNPVEHHVGAPLREIIALAQLLGRRGAPNAALVLVGSTFAEPGRHNYRMPLYSVAKSMIPTLTRALALELGANGKRCIAVVFDVIQGGMNASAPKATLLAHADRTPTGALPNTEEAAAQIAWVLDNPSTLASGATITLSGGALP